MTTTDWTQDEINALMSERDAALDDAAAARLLWRQSEAACAQMHAQRDAAQKLVAEMRAAEAHHAQALRSALCVARAAIVDPVRLTLPQIDAALVAHAAHLKAGDDT